MATDTLIDKAAASLGIAVGKLAEVMNTNETTIWRWRTGARAMSGPVRALLMIAIKEPAAFRRALSLESLLPEIKVASSSAAPPTPVEPVRPARTPLAVAPASWDEPEPEDADEKPGSSVGFAGDAIPPPSGGHDPHWGNV